MVSSSSDDALARFGTDDQDEMGRCSIEMTQTSCRATQSFGFHFGRSGQPGFLLKKFDVSYHKRNLSQII